MPSGKDCQHFKTNISRLNATPDVRVRVRRVVVAVPIPQTRVRRVVPITANVQHRAARVRAGSVPTALYYSVKLIYTLRGESPLTNPLKEAFCKGDPRCPSTRTTRRRRRSNTTNPRPPRSTNNRQRTAPSRPSTSSRKNTLLRFRRLLR